MSYFQNDDLVALKQDDGTETFERIAKAGVAIELKNGDIVMSSDCRHLTSAELQEAKRIGV